MHARVWQLRILPGKLEEFTSAARSLIPPARQQKGFRGVLVLHTGAGEPREVLIVSVWESLEELKASEKNLFLYQALARLLSFCEGLPSIREHEVLISDLF